MEEKNYSTPMDMLIRFMFVSLIGVIILYIFFEYDFLCAAGIFLGFFLGILVIYSIINSPVEEDVFEYDEPYHSRKKVSTENPRAKNKGQRDADEWDEEQEADEDLAIAYEAMNDWEDFDKL